MCGISCTVKCKKHVSQNSMILDCGDKSQVTERLDKLLKRRGPNFSDKKFISNGPLSNELELSSHVLWTQGQQISTQPFCDKNESKFLLFNGDIYSFGTCADFDNTHINSNGQSDGRTLFNYFVKCDVSNKEASLNSFSRIIGSLRGPFAFIYYDKDKNSLIFGRDFFGRESLLFSISCDGSSMVISSVSVYANVFEIPAAGIFYWDLNENSICVQSYECHDRKFMSSNLEKFGSFLKDVEILLYVNTQSRIKIREFSTLIKPVCKLSESNGCNEVLKKIMQCAEIRNMDTPELLKDLSIILTEEIAEFLSLLRNSVNRRVKCQPNFCKNCITTCTNCVNKHSKIAVLFSGGLDSTVLAFLALECLLPGESLDLINVAFSRSDKFDSVPDRETGLQSYKVLKSIFEPQEKTVNFVAVDIEKEEVEKMREQIIRDLIAPLTSVLDDSLGCCLWFAGRCAGLLNEQNTFYTSPARILLLGSGADELLGGYGRHRNAYKKFGWVGLADEMQEDIDRISMRNLGRDNRIVSDHGVCPRMPYLDEDVVSFVTGKCDIWIKCCPLEIGALSQRGLGEKLLLRATAFKLLGEDNANLALFPKRAMQFGSRIAKLENSKEKGSEECSRLVTSINTS